MFVPRSDHELAVLDVEDGREIAVISGFGGPVATAGRFVVARRGDVLAALEPGGLQMWTAELPTEAELIRLTGNGEILYVAISGRYGGSPCPLD